ncbi:MAG: hypothetical protein RL077_5850 [Verrucomicrobiota bacterium]|jgi:nicotinamide-nucleotide amidase
MSTSAAELKALMVARPGRTLAVAESLTCGRLQARIGEISGASAYFLGGMTAYSVAQKVRHLGVDEVGASRVNGVSVEVASAMAQGVCRLFESDLGVATTGYAERSRADGVIEPYAWWALAVRRGGRIATVRTGRIECPGSTRVDAQDFVAAGALAELVAYLRTENV